MGHDVQRLQVHQCQFPHQVVVLDDQMRAGQAGETVGVRSGRCGLFRHRQNAPHHHADRKVTA
ncbi:hypothetical protein D9M68_938140 [compost metagenome]